MRSVVRPSVILLSVVVPVKQIVKWCDDAKQQCDAAATRDDLKWRRDAVTSRKTNLF